jgi:hypothetical protein
MAVVVSKCGVEPPLLDLAPTALNAFLPPTIAAAGVLAVEEEVVMEEMPVSTGI